MKGRQPIDAAAARPAARSARRVSGEAALKQALHEMEGEMRTDEFTEEPQDDPLQLAADAAFQVLKERLGEDSFSCVISLRAGDSGCTAMTFPGYEEGDYAQLAFQVQLTHTMMSARALGIEISVIEPDLN
jgi:hypothetical protein